MRNGEKGNAAVIGVIVLAVIIAGVWWAVSALLGGNDKLADSAKNSDKQTIASVASSIEDKNIGGICSYTDKKDTYLSTTSVQKTGTTNFVNLAKEIAKSDKCDSFQYALSIDVKDARGEASEQPILVFRTDADNKAKFDAYDWDNLKGQEVGTQLQSDEILTKIRTDVKDVSLDNVMYMGSNSDLE